MEEGGRPAEPFDAHSGVEPPSILSKAFDLLRAFNANERVMTLSELARASGLPKSTVHRLIARLIDLGAIEQHRSGYKVGLGLFEIAVNTPAGGLRDAAMPALAALHRWTRQSIHLAVLRDFDVVYLEKLAPPDSPVTLSAVGARLPANCTAIGKAMLAWEDLQDLAAFLPSPMSMMTQYSITDVDGLMRELSKIRAEGIAHERNEAQLGLACLAAPIVIHGFAVGAISISHSADTELPARAETALLDTAAHVARVAKQGLQGHPHYFPREL